MIQPACINSGDLAGAIVIVGIAIAVAAVRITKIICENRHG